MVMPSGRSHKSHFAIDFTRKSNVLSLVEMVLRAGMESAGLTEKINLILHKTDKIHRDKKSGKYRQILSKIGPPSNLDDNDKMSH